MFNRRRVTCTRSSLIDTLTPDEHRAVLVGVVAQRWADTKFTMIYATEDQAVRASRFLMNKDVPYVQRG